MTRIRTQGFISRHAHPCPVHGLVLSGQWRYAERDWVATAGSYLFEPPGDIHTLMAEGEESMTLFWITGTLLELDEEGNTTGYADVFTRIEQAVSVVAGNVERREVIRQVADGSCVVTD